jgi:hypothetical protein
MLQKTQENATLICSTVMQDDPLAAALSSGRLTRGEMRISYNRQVLLLCTQPLDGQLVCNLVIPLTVTGRITNDQRPTQLINQVHHYLISS